MSRGSKRFSWRAALVVAATIAVAGWIGYEYSQWPPPPPASPQAVAQSDERTPEPRPTPRPVRVALLTDSPPIDDSWLARAMDSPELSRYTAGRAPQAVGTSTADLLPLVDRVSKSDWVIVQAGSSDVLLGRTSEDIAADVIEVLQAVDAAGPQVVWATTPPLAADGAEVLELNAQMSRWTQRNDVPVLDLFGAVGDSDGTYVDGLSDDGAEPNEAALQAQARAARRQLPALLRAGNADD